VNPPPEALQDLRDQIDSADAALLRALAARYAAVQGLAEVKRTHGLPAVDPGREATLEAHWRTIAATLGLPDDVALSVMGEVLRTCRAAVVARCADTPWVPS